MKLKTAMVCLFLGVVSLGGLASAQSAQESREEIIDLLGKLPELLQSKEALRKQGFEGEKLALAQEHERLILQDKVIAGYLADRLIALYDGNLSNAVIDAGLVGALFDSGLSNLPQSDLLFYHKMQRVFLDGMTPRECGLLVKGQMGATRAEALLGRTEARMSAQSLKTYYRIQRKAMNLGVTRAPKLLSPADTARIHEKIATTLRARVESMPNSRQLASAFANMNRASPASACAAGKLYSDVILSLTGRDQQHALLYISAP